MTDPTILGDAPPSDSEHVAHRDFGMGALDALSLLVAYLAKSGAIKPEELRAALMSAGEYAAEHESNVRALPLRHLADRLASFIETRDAACFDKTLEAARAAGKLAVEFTTTAAQ